MGWTCQAQGIHALLVLADLLVAVLGPFLALGCGNGNGAVFLVALLQQGIGDLELETQYSWMSIGDRPVHAALALAVRIPTGDEDKDLGEGSVAVEPVAILAVNLAALNGGQLFLNLGADIDKDQTEKLINVGAFMPLRNWVPSLEWNWSEEEEERYLTPGLTWHADDAWYVGLGVPVGLDDEADDYRLIFQIVYERMGR